MHSRTKPVKTGQLIRKVVLISIQDTNTRTTSLRQAKVNKQITFITKGNILDTSGLYQLSEALKRIFAKLRKILLYCTHCEAIKQAKLYSSVGKGPNLTTFSRLCLRYPKLKYS